MAKKAAANKEKAGGKKEKSPQEKKKLKRNVALGVAAFIVLFVWYGIQPLQGPQEVGICRTFAEMKLKYPQTMKLTTTDQFADAMRLYFTFTGPFGENRSSMIECRITTDPATGQPRILSINIDRIPVSDAEVQEFNSTVPYIMQHNPNRIIPPPYEDDLYRLKRD